MEFSPIELEQCFCSCSWVIGEHLADCPNKNKPDIIWNPEMTLTFCFANGKIAKLNVTNYEWVDLGEQNDEWPEPSQNG